MTERVRVGAFELIALVDGRAVPSPMRWSFPEVPPAQWEPHRGGGLDEQGHFHTNFGVFCLRGEAGTVLVDTGIGPGPNAYLGGGRGTLAASLAGWGLRPEDVDHVVMTHLHFDHVGWNLEPGREPRRPFFPRATYWTTKADWDLFSGAAEGLGAWHRRAFDEQVRPLRELGVLRIAAGEQEILPGLRTLPAPGHTPGHQCVLLESHGERAIVTGDLVHSALQVTHPEWCHRADLAPDQAVRTRRAILELAESTGMVVAAGHLLLGSNIGHVVAVEGRRFWRGADLAASGATSAP